MNFRFLLILLLAILTLLGWTFVHHQYLSSRQFRLDQLSELPLYVYMDDPVEMVKLGKQLETEVPQIKEMETETGVEAMEELLRTYPELAAQPNVMQEYQLPNILTIFFKPSEDAFKGRDDMLEIVKGEGLGDDDFDDQDPAWGQLRRELDYLSSRWSNSTLFIALVVFLMLVYARLFLYLEEAQAVRGMRYTVLENIRAREKSRWQNLLLLVVPIAVNFGSYHLLRSLDVFNRQVDWPFFAVQFIAVGTAILVSILIHGMREQAGPSAPAITVKKPLEPHA